MQAEEQLAHFREGFPQLDIVAPAAVGKGILAPNRKEQEAYIEAWQQYYGCLISKWALIPAAIAMLLIIPAEVGTQPFDVAEAETEICEGPLIEYSGRPLAIFKLNTAIKMFIMTSLFTVLFLGGIDTGFVWLNAIILVAIDICLTVLCMTFIHAVTARLKIEHLFKFYWTVVAALTSKCLPMD